MTKSDGTYIKMTVEELLPKSFGPHSLQEERVSPASTATPEQRINGVDQVDTPVEPSAPLL